MLWKDQEEKRKTSFAGKQTHGQAAIIRVTREWILTNLI
jgi:hypothetical protein